MRRSRGPRAAVLRAKSLLVAVLFAFGAVFLLFDTMQDNQGPPPAPAKKPAPVRAKKAPQEPNEPWPYPSRNQAGDQVAQNLLARNFLLVFDGSGSMNEKGCSNNQPKIQVAKQAVAQWAQTVPQDANLGLVAFHQDKWTVLPLAMGNREEFIAKVDQIRAGGGTPLSNSLEYSFGELTKQGRNQLGYGEYTIVVVTDGIANSQQTLTRYVNGIIGNSPINIFTIGFCIGQNHSLNQPGRTEYRAANNPAELSRGLAESLAESETFDTAEFEQQ